MTEAQDRRRHLRRNVSWFVTLENSGATIIGETKDISPTGAFIYCDSPPEPKQIFKLIISAPEMRTSLTGEARVVWSAPYGIGVRFRSLSRSG
jgi:hypothetical protein